MTYESDQTMRMVVKMIVALALFPTAFFYTIVAIVLLLAEGRYETALYVGLGLGVATVAVERATR